MTQHCDRCPLKRHRRPCPAHWDGCGAVCRLLDVGGSFRLELVAAAAEGDRERFRSRIKSMVDALRVTINHTPRDLDCELVVAAYREQLGWIAGVPCRVMVYSKGGRLIEGVPSAILPNTGREAHTYLAHICDRYDSLAEWTVFAQGGPFDHCPDLVARLSLRPDRALSLAPRYTEAFPGPHITAHDLVEQLDGFELRYGNAAFYAGDNLGTRRGPWMQRVWSALFTCPPPSPWWYGYGATWIVPRHAIVARPLEFWTALRAGLEGAAGRARAIMGDGQHPVTAWAYEVLWRYLFSAPAEFPHRCPPDVGGSELAKLQARIARVKECRHWTREGCGCNHGRCVDGKRPGMVSFQECFDCLGV